MTCFAFASTSSRFVSGDSGIIFIVSSAVPISYENLGFPNKSPFLVSNLWLL
jgi:hypothetical protein